MQSLGLIELLFLYWAVFLRWFVFRFFSGGEGGGCPLRRGGKKTVEDEHGGDYCLLSLSFCVLVVQRV